ncbi:MAG: tyrosine-type recombinase/integrase, partial [Sphaerochaetaceae bacterium]
MRRFCIFKRSGQRIFYAQIKNPETGKYLPARSTGTTDKSEAYMIAANWIRDGVPASKKSSEKRPIQEVYTLDSIIHVLGATNIDTNDALRITSILQDKGIVNNVSINKTNKKDLYLIPFLQEFWDYDKSPYVREKLAYGQSIGKRHCYEQTKKVHHWEKYFAADTKITDITRETLREFQIALKEKHLAPKSINMILTVGTVAFGWLADRGEISNNPSTGLRKFAGEAKKRDILTHDEVRKIFAVKWDDERSRVGNLLAMTTGMRASEVVALQAADIQEDRLLVRHSWSFVDGLKKPKNGEERVVPLLPEIREELVNLLMKNPHDSKMFIFYGPQPDKPMNIDILSKWLTKAYIDITISPDLKDNLDEREKIRKAMLKRGICFHSWRHFYTASLADRIEMRSVQLATGHKTTAMA